MTQPKDVAVQITVGHLDPATVGTVTVEPGRDTNVTVAALLRAVADQMDPGPSTAPPEPTTGPQPPTQPGSRPPAWTPCTEHADQPAGRCGICLPPARPEPGRIAALRAATGRRRANA